MNDNEQLRLTKIVKKIRLFHGLTLPEIESLLRICSYRSYEQGQRVYALGDFQRRVADPALRPS